MKEVKGNLWTLPADIRCITTNGVTNRFGDAVMGRGCALEAKQRFHGIAQAFGLKLRKNGNIVQRIASVGFKTAEEPYELLAFPVKHHWGEPADLQLIEHSAHELIQYLFDNDDACEPHLRVLLPRPGCGNGGRDWETEVKPILAPLLDNRITIVSL